MTYMIVYSQLTLVSLDTFGGAEALPRVDVTHVGVAVTLACWKKKKKRTNVRREREGGLYFESSQYNLLVV